MSFEKRNYKDAGCRSFYRVGKKADCLFHFSSEGEFEQIRPIIDDLIANKSLVELIFTSPSVESKVFAYYHLHPENIRYLRLPLLEYFPFLIRHNILVWSTAKRMMMVRYDFFPELLFLGTKMKKFILFSATLKSSNESSSLANNIKKSIYSCFSDIICATSDDLEQISKMSLPATLHKPLEMRVLQISHRQAQFGKNPLSSSIEKLVSPSDFNDRLCLAQIWENEIDIFKDAEFVSKIKNAEIFVLLAPHVLKEENRLAIENRIKEVDPQLPLYYISNDNSVEDIEKTLESYKKSPGLVISLVRGVLCESYPLFKNVFIGGGHGKGVHSLLEPYVAGSNILCGHNISRSTEYSTILANEGHVEIVNDLSNFYTHFKMTRNLNGPSATMDLIERASFEKIKLLKLLKEQYE